ncbi:MAG: diacylglycerol kinase family lipid kinase [Lachnospiraceae bacterium]|nr:diacylglycerol kinase family lipid kinase [Lachnospiraceae bacterium]
MIYFIVNTTSRSGKGAKVWNELLGIIRESGEPFEIFETQYGGHSTELAKDICEKTTPGDTIAVFGGDGTLNGVINGIDPEKRVTLGFIPFGSGNDFARGTGIVKDPFKALDIILHGKDTKSFDLGEVVLPDGTSRRFCISSGAGYDAAVCDELDKSHVKKLLNRLHIGKLAYFVIGLSQWLKHPKISGSLLLDGKDTVSFNRLSFVSVQNLKYEGGGYPFAPQADPTDGLLSLCVVAIRSRLKFFCALLPSKSIKNWHTRFKGTKLVNCRQATLKLEKKLTVHTDGEVIGQYDAITFRVLPSAMLLKV